jgi:hypothetical protein
MKEKFDELLPWYVTGTLSEKERAEFERYLLSNPDARKEAMDAAQLARGLKSAPIKVASELGMERALEMNREFDVRTKAAPLKPRGSFADWAERLSLRNANTGWLRPAFALAVAVIGIQAALLWKTFETRDAQMRGGAESQTVPSRMQHASFLRITFAPVATEAEIRLLLGGGKAQFVSGPGQSGEYFVAVPDANATALLEALRGSRIVVSANPSSAPE